MHLGSCPRGPAGAAVPPAAISEWNSAEVQQNLLLEQKFLPGIEIHEAVWLAGMRCYGLPQTTAAAQHTGDPI